VKLPHDLSGDALARLLKSYGYEIARQTGSHMRLTTQEHGDHHITIPRHDALRIGTLAGILTDVADHAGIHRDDVAIRLFG
jgi:predicted RNA binding protein YcfA (HicA-like mRNA interferase family)